MMDPTVLLLGRRWPGGRLPSQRKGWREALAAYAHHASFLQFPAMRAGESAPEGEQEALEPAPGLLILDPSDPSAVAEALSEPGCWIMLAVVPEFMKGHQDPEARLRAEALCYGGLRDLELACVALGPLRPALLILDDPGNPPPDEQLLPLGRALLSLAEYWGQGASRTLAWPARCHHVALDVEEGVELSASPWDRVWEQDGELPPGALRVLAAGRLLANAHARCWHQNGLAWLAVGRPMALQDFRVAAITWQSANALWETHEVAWPEPGNPAADGRLRFLRSLSPDPQPLLELPFDYWVAGLSQDRPAPTLPQGLPAYQLNWLASLRMEQA